MVAVRGAAAAAAVGAAPRAGGRAGAPPLGLRLPLPAAALHPLRRLLPAARLGRQAPAQRPEAARTAGPAHPGPGGPLTAPGGGEKWAVRGPRGAPGGSGGGGCGSDLGS